MTVANRLTYICDAEKKIVLTCIEIEWRSKEDKIGGELLFRYGDRYHKTNCIYSLLMAIYWF